MNKSNLAYFYDFVNSVHQIGLVQPFPNNPEDEVINHLEALYGICFHKYTVGFRSDDPSWMCPLLEILMDARDRAFYNHHTEKYKLPRQEVINAIMHLKSSYFSKIDQLSMPRAIWNAIRSLSRRKKTCKSINLVNLEVFNGYHAIGMVESSSFPIIPTNLPNSSITSVGV